MHKITVFNCGGDIFKELVFPSEDFMSDYIKMLIEDLDKLRYYVDFKKVKDKHIIKIEHQIIIIGD